MITTTKIQATSIQLIPQLKLLRHAGRRVHPDARESKLKLTKEGLKVRDATPKKKLLFMSCQIYCMLVLYNVIFAKKRYLTCL
jgi:hypothetical protein